MRYLHHSPLSHLRVALRNYPTRGEQVVWVLRVVCPQEQQSFESVNGYSILHFSNQDVNLRKYVYPALSNIKALGILVQELE